MGLSGHVTLLVLLAAALHATWNAIVKSSPHKLFDTVAITTGAAVICGFALPFIAPPAQAAWPWLGASVALHTVYFLAVAGAYRWGDLSLAYPLMRGLAPLIVALVGVLTLDDPVSLAMWLGIGLICAGILMPALSQRQVQSRQGTFIAVGNAFVIAVYTLVDGVGTRLSGDPLSYCEWLFFLSAFPILALALAVERRGAWQHARSRWKVGLFGGGFSVAAYGIVLWAMTQAPVAAVAALRETSVIIAAAIGTLFFREPVAAIRIAGAVLVAAGVIALRG